MLLVGDIGGTHARLALLADAASVVPVAEQDVQSRDFAGLEELVGAFLQQHRPVSGAGSRAPIERVVFAVAGPVADGHVELTNLGWSLDENRLRDSLGAGSVRLLNDLQVLAYAIPHLPPDSFHTLQRGVPATHGAIAVVAPGTGLGEAFLLWDGTRYRAHPSEGGHGDFAPAGSLQLDLLAWLEPRFGHISYERVCSGRGLPNLYAFLAERGVAPEEEWLKERLATAADPTPVIVAAGLDERARSPLCASTLELFAAILAAEAGNAALRFLATGGVYLGGGMVRRILPVLQTAAFLETFRRKGRLGDLLERIPLHVIVSPRSTVQGAIHYAVASFAEH